LDPSGTNILNKDILFEKSPYHNALYWGQIWEALRRYST
jgi:hypothetical protein